MKCELDYCIYNRNFCCLYKETQINLMGMCRDCIIVSVPVDILEMLKEKQIKDIETRWENETAEYETAEYIF